jgi:transcriptional regulator with XRE-family HTH domain
MFYGCIAILFSYGGNEKMDGKRKAVNIQLGKRLADARKNLGRTQAEFADLLGVTEEHYRKYESGANGLSVDKILLLYQKYGIDPTYLITGACLKNDFDVDYYIANCNKEQKDAFVDRVLAYMSRMIKK